MTRNGELAKFLEAQNQLYLKALAEIRAGQKISHWMWFIFPQIKGLGSSDMSRRFAINDREEAAAYLEHPVLGKHLVEISSELLKLEGRTALQVFGSPDDRKLFSSMTLFSTVPGSDPIFAAVLEKYFNGLQDERTLQLLSNDRLSLEADACTYPGNPI